jgi:hypothetical protein
MPGSARLLSKEIPSITVTNVVEDGGPLHGLGLAFDAFSCGREFIFAEICPELPSEDDIEDSQYGYLSLPFAIAGRQKSPVRCTPERIAQELIDAFEDAAEYQVGQVLWFGDTNWADGSGGDQFNRMFLTSGAVATSAVSADPKAAVAELLFDAYEAHPELDPIIHLGMGSAVRIGMEAMDILNVPYVVNPAYPIDGIAVTGPIKIFLGTVQDLSHVQWTVNRRYAEGTRLGLIQFDPCLARLGVSGS